MPANTRNKTNSMSASGASENDNNNDLNEIEGGLEAVMQTFQKHVLLFHSIFHYK